MDPGGVRSEPTVPFPDHAHPNRRTGLQYRDGLAVLRHVPEAPAWMSWDDRLDAWIAPGYMIQPIEDL